MSNATNAEEAAIRPIAPAFSIINLTGGNIASRGNTSCLLQESRLGLILPNLPENCRVVIVKRRDTSSRMRSTKYKRYNIETMLRLLRRTGHPAWANIEVSDQNVQAWDEHGDLADTLSTRGTNVVIERDENGEEVTADVDVLEQDSTGHPSPVPYGQVETLNDGGDTGPAELQNTEIEEETYEAVLDLGETSLVGLENA